MSRLHLRRSLAVASLFLAGGLSPLTGLANAAASSTNVAYTLRTLAPPTTTTFAPTTAGSAAPSDHQLAPDLEARADAAAGITPGGHRVANRTGSERAHGKATAPLVGAIARSIPVGSTGAATAQFDGLNLFDQRTANKGNQFTVEPPDQALCVGGGQVVEAVNDVLAVYNESGVRSGVTDLNTLLGYPAQFNRTTHVTGPFVTDPVCTYDAPTGTFFLVTLTLDVTPAGDFTGKNTLDVATTKHPTGTWSVYHLPVQDDGTGGTPSHPGCPCIGDYPHIGADANGFYITTNEYPFFANGFVAAQVYAFPKAALAHGARSVVAAQFDTTAMDGGKPGFTVWPALSPAGQYSPEAGGTEYFLSSNAAEEATGTLDYHGTQIVTWSLTGTRTLGSSKPALNLNAAAATVPDYYLPPLADQKAGSVPLADCLNLTACAKTLLAKPSRYTEVEGRLDAGDTRMQQVTYTGGKLYGALDTAVAVSGGVKAGIASYTSSPTTSSRAVVPGLITTDTVGVDNNNIIYPTIGVTGTGAGVMSFTLAGPQYFPSQAYMRLSGVTTVQVTAAGVGPQDGFSEYRAFGDPPRPRWGDYGASAVVGKDIWVANEVINQTCALAEYTASPFGRCGGARVALGNWGTSITKITP